MDIDENFKAKDYTGWNEASDLDRAAFQANMLTAFAPSALKELKEMTKDKKIDDAMLFHIAQVFYMEGLLQGINYAMNADRNGYDCSIVGLAANDKLFDL